MKSSKVRVLDKNDHILIKALSNLGMSRNAATTMAYLMNVDEASSQEIEISNWIKATRSQSCNCINVQSFLG